MLLQPGQHCKGPQARRGSFRLVMHSQQPCRLPAQLPAALSLVSGSACVPGTSSACAEHSGRGAGQAQSQHSAIQEGSTGAVQAVSQSYS